MLITTGIPDNEDIITRKPPEERLKKGPVVMIECFQKIPCNPCYTACKRGAIQEFKDINDTPAVDFDKCNGCALCVSKCPGLAIFVIDETFSECEAAVSLPFEFLPIPKAGEMVSLLNRGGKKVGQGKVLKIRNSKYDDRTPVITVTVPKELSMIVRNIRVEGGM